MTKTQVFNTIKEANRIVDKMAKLIVGSPEYVDLNESLYWMLDSLTYDKRRKYSLHFSDRTGHYYVRY